MGKSLKELQEVAESKGREYFMDERMVCLHSTLYAVKDAMSEVDDIDAPFEVVVRGASTATSLSWKAGTTMMRVLGDILEESSSGGGGGGSSGGGFRSSSWSSGGASFRGGGRSSGRSGGGGRRGFG